MLNQSDFDGAYKLYLLAESQGIKLFLDGQKLRYKVKTGYHADPVLIEKLAGSKPELVVVLQAISYRNSTDWTAVINERKLCGASVLSYNQESFYFIELLHEGFPNHISSVWQIKGRINETALAMAFRSVMQRHEVLRTIFLEKDGMYYQHVLPADGWTLYATLGDYTNETERTAVIAAFQSRPFDLRNEFPVRVCLFQGLGDHSLLAVTVHHIAADGWSWSLLLREIEFFYDAHNRRSASQLPELPIQYADYAFWQRHSLSWLLLAGKLQYWAEKLRGASYLDLSANQKKKPSKLNILELAQTLEDQLLLSRLSALAISNNTTLYVVLVTVFKVLLSRHTGQTDICIGSPVSGRIHAEAAQLIGLFTNTVALRSDLSGNPEFTELLTLVKNTVLEANENQEVPFNKVVENVLSERYTGRHPFFPVLFTVEPQAADEGLKLHGLEITDVPFDRVQTSLDFVFTVSIDSLGLHCQATYDDSLFRREWIEQLLRQYILLLQKFIEKPTARISDLPLLLPGEKEKIQAFESLRQPYPLNKTIVDLFAEQVSMTPFAIAIKTDMESLSYTALNEKSNQLASYLLDYGIDREQPVGVFMRRSAELLIAFLAILKCGAAYVPLDPDYPVKRLDYLLSDTGTILVLGMKADEHAISGFFKGSYLAIDGKFLELAGKPVADLSIRPDSGQLAYIMYTSGTTGHPKGVMVEHRNVTSLIKGSGIPEVSPGDVLLATGSPSFDASTFEYWGTLLAGGQLVLYGKEDLLDIFRLKNIIRRYKVTIMWFTSGWFNQLVDIDAETFLGLRYLLVGGEKLSPVHVGQLRRSCPSVRIINGYGPTENTTFSLYFPIEDDYDDTKEIPIGTPLFNRSVYILDNEQQRVPIGMIGEIWVGGHGIARGYWRQDALTHERFVAAPPAVATGEKLYRTGDLGKWLPDGNVVYQGRIDSQLKIRGVRVELEEVENLILESGIVKQCAVVADQAEAGVRLIGYLVTDTDFNISLLSAYLNDWLPVYMIPSVWINLPDFPITAHGKTDRAKLPLPDREPAKQDPDLLSTPTQLCLAEIWRELLGAVKIGAQNNFFASGGHSLLIAPYLYKIKERIGHELKIKDIFNYQTLEHMAAFLERLDLDEKDILKTSADNNPIVALNSSLTLCPLFLLPGSPGFVEPYAALAAGMAEHYHVLGVRLPGLQMDEVMPENIKQTATQLKALIKKFQPTGPYRFIGHSFGAYLAFEISALFELEKETVEFLCLLDAARHDSVLLRIPTGSSMNDALIAITVELLSDGLDIDIPDLKHELSVALQNAYSSDKAKVIEKHVHSHLSGQINNSIRQLIITTLIRQSLMCFQPDTVLKTRVLVVKAMEEDWSASSEYLGWETQAKNIFTVNAQGNHMTMVQGRSGTDLGNMLSVQLLLSTPY
jgi:amino acid adenylation domain-containing protein